MKKILFVFMLLILSFNINCKKCTKEERAKKYKEHEEYMEKYWEEERKKKEGCKRNNRNRNNKNSVDFPINGVPSTENLIYTGGSSMTGSNPF